MPVTWNPWHGCHKLSPGCMHCYVYRSDKQHGKNSARVTKNADFDLPVRRRRDGSYKIPSGELVYTCFTSDFFVEDADSWRDQAWEMIRARKDCRFLMITKRIDRFFDCIPADWGEGYENVHICCTVENQDRADYRLPLYIDAPICHKSIICEPLLEKLDLSSYLGSWAEELIAGGESGNDARICNFDWVLDLRRQCMEKGVAFYFKQTGARFVKDGKHYRIKRQFQHKQAKKADIDFIPEGRNNEI